MQVHYYKTTCICNESYTSEISNRNIEVILNKLFVWVFWKYAYNVKHLCMHYTPPALSLQPIIMLKQINDLFGLLAEICTWQSSEDSLWKESCMQAEAQ